MSELSNFRTPAMSGSRALITLLALCLLSTCTDEAVAQRSTKVAEKYKKSEYRIKMRDGAQLFTAVYVPRDASERKKYPILLTVPLSPGGPSYGCCGAACHTHLRSIA